MFENAKPIFLKGLSEQMNVQARFVTELCAAGDCELRLAGATFYKVRLDGRLIHHGPAPTAHGHARVDIIPLGRGFSSSLLEIEVAGYFDDSYAAVKSPSYVIAEVITDGKCVAATGQDFRAYRVSARAQKVLRYSSQRHFSEIWNLDIPDSECEWEIVDIAPRWLERRAPMPEITRIKAKERFAEGRFTVDAERLFSGEDPLAKKLNTRGFDYSEIPISQTAYYAAMDYEIKKSIGSAAGKLRAGEYRVFELENNTSGLIDLCYDAGDGARVFIVFEERIYGGGRLLDLNGCVNNIIEVRSSGLTDFENFEIYGFKYFAVFVIEGEIDLRSAGITRIRNSISKIPRLNTDDTELLSIYDAAVETYLCNSLAIFMDCPTRERAGWLCDSYYTSQTEFAFTGENLVESDFLENFSYSPGENLPRGMVPMCYPANFPTGKHIPQWTLWLLLELREYRKRRGELDIAGYLPMVDGLLTYFSGFENELGLLEDLPGWNFVEWSRANDWTDGINFPTNMLYAAALDAMAELLCRPELSEKASAIRKKVVEMCYDGRYFHDQALRDNSGRPVVNRNISEACQYYAFKFGVAVGEDYEPLRKMLITEFAPENTVVGIERANVLMGLYMRMELLLEWGENDRLVSEIRNFYGHMARISGTLWEHKNGKNSLNHGFASFVAVPLLKIFGSR